MVAVSLRVEVFFWVGRREDRMSNFSNRDD